MFTRKLHNADPTKATKLPNPATPHYQMADFGYGRKFVRVFQLKKDGPVHTVTEYKVHSQFRLKGHKEYYDGDNSEIVGSDVMETIIYMHAKKHGLKTPEEFALSLSDYYLKTYDIGVESNVIVEQTGWQRFGELEKQDFYKGQLHNHVFTRNTSEKKWCAVVRSKEAINTPLLIGGLDGLRMVKTARSPFVGYIKGSLFTEGDNPDRILSIDVNAQWQYSSVEGIDFNTHWYRVREVLLKAFAGDPVEGVTITSVQYGSYQMARAVLDAMPEICSVSISLNNYKHFEFDFSRFPAFDKETDVIIANPGDEPCSVGYTQLDRKTFEEEKLKAGSKK